RAAVGGVLPLDRAGLRVLFAVQGAGGASGGGACGAPGGVCSLEAVRVGEGDEIACGWLVILTWEIEKGLAKCQALFDKWRRGESNPRPRQDSPRSLRA